MRRLVEDALVERHEIRPVHTRRHLEDIGMGIGPERRVHDHQGVRHHSNDAGRIDRFRILFRIG